jgi:hypothetical protein
LSHFWISATYTSMLKGKTTNTYSTMQTLPLHLPDDIYLNYGFPP